MSARRECDLSKIGIETSISIIMHLAVEAVAAKYGGAATVLLDFLQAAVDDDRITRISVFCAPEAERDFSLAWSDKLVAIPRYEKHRIARLRWALRGVGRQAQAIGADAVLCMSGQGQAVLPMPHVTFIQQSLPFSPEALATISCKRRFEMRLIRYLMRRSCRTAQRVIVQTPTMADWTARAFALDQDKIRVVMPVARWSNSAAEEAEELARMRAVPPGARLLYVGSSAEYKMLTTIVAGLRMLREVVPQTTLFLTLDPSSPFAREPGVVCLGPLRRELLQPAYRLATALVLPSLVETVGLPMIEAMSLGTPVVAADRPYAHDVCKHAAVRFDPWDTRDFVDKTTRVLCDERLQQQMRAEGLALSKRRQADAPYPEMVDMVVSAAQRIPIPRE